MENSIWQQVGYKDPLLHTRIAHYLEQPVKTLCETPQRPFPRTKFADFRDCLAYDIALLVRMNLFEREEEKRSGDTYFSNESNETRGFISLAGPASDDRYYPSLGAYTKEGTLSVRYYPVPSPTPLEINAEAVFENHRLRHDPSLATFAFSVYLWYLYAYEQCDVYYVRANGTPVTAEIKLPPSVRIYSAKETKTTSRFHVPETLEYLELGDTLVDGTIVLPVGLKGYAAARTATKSSLDRK